MHDQKAASMAPGTGRRGSESNQPIALEQPRAQVCEEKPRSAKVVRSKRMQPSIRMDAVRPEMEGGAGRQTNGTAGVAVAAARERRSHAVS